MQDIRNNSIIEMVVDMTNEEGGKLYFIIDGKLHGLAYKGLSLPCALALSMYYPGTTIEVIPTTKKMTKKEVTLLKAE